MSPPASLTCLSKRKVYISSSIINIDLHLSDDNWLISEVRQANVICVVYSVIDESSVDRIQRK